ncbi:MAG: hypothetical protein KAJ95_04065 [Gammaproteobacteria bacterium]|nr:hypothetical protein [Gammaproteobacteria bacterium]
MTMTNEEVTMLHSQMDRSSKYLEFGSGDSTVYASCVPSINTIDSVESSADFVNKMLKTNPAIQTALSMGKLEFHLIDIGVTGNFGYPVDDSKKHLWPDYSQNIFKKSSNHDLVLIDGRFRVACTLQCILNEPKDCIIMIHDFWNRAEYHVLLKYLTLIDKVDTLGVFDITPESFNDDEIRSLITRYQYLPGDIAIA